MKKLIVLIALLASAVSCKKPITEPNSGIYKGTFFQIFNDNDTNAQGIATLALTKDGFGGTFTMTGDTNSGAPYSCYGDFSVDNGTKITYSNKASVDVGYQPHYLLDTTYTYTFDNTNFLMKLVIDTTEYQYNLVRI